MDDTDYSVSQLNGLRWPTFKFLNLYRSATPARYKTVQLSYVLVVFVYRATANDHGYVYSMLKRFVCKITVVPHDQAIHLGQEPPISSGFYPSFRGVKRARVLQDRPAQDDAAGGSEYKMNQKGFCCFRVPPT